MNRSSLMQAAVVLNSLPKKQAAQLLSRLEPGDLKLVLDAVTRLDDVSAEQLTECLTKLSEDAERWRLIEEGESTPELEDAKKKIEVALSVVPKRKPTNFDSDQPFAFLLDTIPMLRDHVLSDEHPRNIAIVLSCFPPEVASRCMNSLDHNLQVSVVKRLCELEEIDDHEIRQLSYALRMRLNKVLNSRAAKTIGMETAAEMLSCSDSLMKESLLTHVAQTDPDLAYKLQRSMFSIERLVSLEDDEVKAILKHVDTASWAPAIKNATPALIDTVMSNMGETPRRLLAREIDQIGAVSERAESEARKSIIQVALRLAREGKVELRKNGPRSSVPVLSTAKVRSSETFQIG